MPTLSSRTRRPAAAAGFLAAVVALGACAGSPVDDAPATSATGTGAFPVTIDTAYGEIAVDEEPERIVALDAGFIELLDYVDEEPVAFASYLSDDEELLLFSPWMEGTYEGEPDPGLFTADFLPAVEAIAALEPDLILTTIWQTDEELYEQLSQVAPTYVGTEPDTNTSWQDNLTAIATLTGNDPSVVDEVQAELDATLTEHAGGLTGLRERTFQVAALGGDDQLWLTEYANVPITGLGMVPGEGQPTNGEEGANAPTFSQETADQLTSDVVFVATEHRDPSGDYRAVLDADPRVAALPSSQNGTLLYLTAQQWNAVNGGSPVSVTWWLDEVVPALAGSALNQAGL